MHVINLFFGLPDRCHATPAGNVSSADQTQSFTFITASCPLGIKGASHRVHVGDRTVTVQGYGPVGKSFVAVWEQQPGTYVEVGGANVTEAQLVHFIAGLRVAYPSYLHHH